MDDDGGPPPVATVLANSAARLGLGVDVLDWPTNVNARGARFAPSKWYRMTGVAVFHA